MGDRLDGVATFAYHVGAHKTGTSLLQHYLVENRENLRNRRILYLGRGVAETIARAGDEPQFGEQAREHLRRFERRQGSFDTFLASYENALGPPFGQARVGRGLYPRAAARATALAETMRPFRPRIMLGIRPVEDFVDSYYLQFVHQGGYLRFDDWLAEHVDFDRLSWRPVVDDLVSAFGVDAVEVVDFRLIGAAGTEGYLKEMLSRLLPGTTFDIGTRAVSNASISEKGLRLALAANPHLRDRDEQRAMRRFLQGRFSNLRYPRPVLLSEEQKTWLRERYRADYDDLVGAAAPTLAERTSRADPTAR